MRDTPRFFQCSIFDAPITCVQVIENQAQGAAIKVKKQEEIETFEGGVIKGYKWRDFGIDSPRSGTAPQNPAKPEEVKKP